MYVELSTLHHVKSVSGDWVLVGSERAAQLMEQTDLRQKHGSVWKGPSILWRLVRAVCVVAHLLS